MNQSTQLESSRDGQVWTPLHIDTFAMCLSVMPGDQAVRVCRKVMNNEAVEVHRADGELIHVRKVEERIRDLRGADGRRGRAL